jgi:crotonobetainyl-CoA:carnitine CoA-transferase CaiB-like acyl-CoA transferase
VRAGARPRQTVRAFAARATHASFGRRLLYSLRAQSAMGECAMTIGSQPARGPLAGVKVLELAQIMAGPTCGMMLADLGADVIKVEKLPGGDDSRGYSEPRVNGESAPYLILNRGKRGIALDLKHPKGKAVLERLVAGADVLTENYRRGTLERLGLGYEHLRGINPGLIYCAVSGYGRTGPWADKGGFDLIAQGFAGLMSITGEPGGPPAKSGSPIADINAGILAALGVLAAYVHKLKTGEGQLVETSLMEAALQQTYWHAAIFFATGRSPGALGSSHVLTAPYQAFRTADGYVNIGGANQANWARIAQVLGHPEWIEDARFVTNDARMRNREALVEAMERVLVAHDREHWMGAFDAAGVPAGPVHSIGEALTHEQVLARDMVVEVEHARAGRTRSIGFPVKFGATPAGSTGRGAPMLGEHSRAVLREAGYSVAEIDALVAEGVVASAD